MAKLNPKSAIGTLRFSSFGGITAGNGFGKAGAKRMKNFRILPDGSLEKRCGFQSEYDFDRTIRGFWEGSLGGVHRFFAVGGNRVYSYNESNQTAATISYLTTSAGKVRFLEFGGLLLLLDGANIYRFSTASGVFTEASGYAPLYGENWHPTNLGKIKEPLNLFTTKIRLHYLNTSGATTFNLPFPAERIDRLYINSTAISTYSFNSGSSSFSIPSAYASGTVEVYCTLTSLFNQRALIASSLYAEMCNSNGVERLFLFGSAPGYRLYYSAPVSSEMLSESQTVFTSSDILYFPKDGFLTLGDSNHPLTSVCSDGSRLLVANRQKIWGVEFEAGSDIPISYPIVCGIGALGFGQFFRFGKHLLSIGESGVYILKDFEKNEDSCKVIRISDTVSDLLGDWSFERTAVFWKKDSDELWFRDPLDEEGKIFIYDISKDCWILYTGIDAEFFLQAGNRFGFFDVYGALCFFSEELNTDDGSTITAEYESHNLDLPMPELQKRIVSGLLGSATTDAHLSLTLTTEKRSQTFAVPAASSLSEPSLFDLRWAPGRFRTLRWSVSHTGTDRITINFLSVSVKN